MKKPLNPKRSAPHAEAKGEHLISLRNRSIKRQARRSAKMVAIPNAEGRGKIRNGSIKGEKTELKEAAM